MKPKNANSFLFVTVFKKERSHHVCFWRWLRAGSQSPRVIRFHTPDAPKREQIASAFDVELFTQT